MPAVAAAVIVVGLVAVFLVYRAAAAGLASVDSPQQPVNFPHSIHAGALKLDCLFCHRDAAVGPNAGIPSVEQCMFCHSAIATDRPEVQKVIAAFQNNQPIDWVRVNRLPDHVHFVHQPHISAGVQCSTCHGDVQTMTRVTKFKAFQMGDCVSCHRQLSAPTECATCHY